MGAPPDPPGPGAAPPGYRQLRLCAGGGGFEALPERPRRLDLSAVRDRFARDGVRVVDAGVMLIVGLEVEVTISRGGRVLLKTRDGAVAERLLPRVLAAMDPTRAR